MGGQRLKLHHKSHPERKHEVTPSPPFHPPLFPLSPCGPALSSLLLYVSLPSLCFCVQRVPHGWTRCILYYSFMYFKRQTAQFRLNPSTFHLPLLPFSSLRLPACCKAINHSADPIGKGGEKNEGGRRLKHRRQEGRKGKKKLG